LGDDHEKKSMTKLLLKAAKLAALLRVSAWRNALQRHRVAAGAEHLPVLRQLTGCRTIVDIGANRGQFALVARHCFPAARIVSFEPLPGPAAIFRRVFADDHAVKLHEAAVGPQSVWSTIHISARDDSSSLLPIAPLQSAMFPGTAEVSTTEVAVAPLNAFIEALDISAPALLKLDVQGFELQALAGCEPLLSHFDWVYCECSFVELYAGQKLAAEVIDWLSDRGFRLRGMFNPAYDGAGQAIQSDFLFRRNEAAVV
jgi:FkbM family methyltransferase